MPPNEVVSRKLVLSLTVSWTLPRRSSGTDASIALDSVERPGSMATAEGIISPTPMFTPVTTLRNPAASRDRCTLSLRASSSSNEYGCLSATRMSMSPSAIRLRTNASAGPFAYSTGGPPGVFESADPTKISGRSAAIREAIFPTTSAACCCADAWSSVQPFASATRLRSGWGSSFGHSIAGLIAGSPADTGGLAAVIMASAAPMTRSICGRFIGRLLFRRTVPSFICTRGTSTRWNSAQPQD